MYIYIYIYISQICLILMLVVFISAYFYGEEVGVRHFMAGDCWTSGLRV